MLDMRQVLQPREIRRVNQSVNGAYRSGERLDRLLGFQQPGKKQCCEKIAGAMRRALKARRDQSVRMVLPDKQRAGTPPSCRRRCYSDELGLQRTRGDDRLALVRDGTSSEIAKLEKIGVSMSARGAKPEATASAVSLGT